MVEMSKLLVLCFFFHLHLLHPSIVPL